MHNYNPLDLKKRFVFVGEEFAAEAIANMAAKKSISRLPTALHAILDQATKIEGSGVSGSGTIHMERLKNSIFQNGKAAAEQALRRLAPTTKAQAQAIAKAAVEKVAQTEYAAAKVAAEEVIKKNAQKIATEAAARKAAQKVGTKTATKAAGEAAKKGAAEAAKKVAAETAKKAVAETAKQTAKTAVQQGGNALARVGAQEGGNALARAGAQKAGNALVRVGAQEGGKALARAGAQKAAETAIRTGALKAAELAATRALPQAAARGAMVLASNTGLATVGETALTVAAEGAVASGAALAGAIAAAVVGVSLAGWQGYELYSDIERGGWVTGGEMEEAAAKNNAARYNVETIDADTRDAERVMSDKLRGASMVVRNSASDIIVECREYGELAGDKERLGNLVKYSEKAKGNLQSAMDKADKKSATYKEAEKAMGALTAALEMAGLVISTDEKLSEDNDFVKKALEAKVKALFEKRKTSDLLNIDLKIKLLGTLDNDKKTELISGLQSIKGEIGPIDNEESYNKTIGKKLDDLLKKSNELLLADSTKLTAENIGAITKIYLAKNITSPELRNNAEFVTRMMGLAAGLVTPSMTVKEFDAAMRSAFANGEFAPNNMVPISEYFEQVMVNDKPAIDGAEWDCWDAFTSSYLLGLAHRAKNHPALGSSSQAYIDEIQQMFNDSNWQKTMPKEAQFGGPAFQEFIMKSLAERNLSSPEQYFNYKEKPSDSGDKQPDANRTAGATSRTGSPRTQPGVTPKTPEQNKDVLQEDLRSAVVGTLAPYIPGQITIQTLKKQGITSAELLGTKALNDISAALKSKNFKSLAGQSLTFGPGININIDNSGNATVGNPNRLQEWGKSVWTHKENEIGPSKEVADKEADKAKENEKVEAAKKTAAMNRVKGVIRTIIRMTKNLSPTTDPKRVLSRLQSAANGLSGEISAEDKATLAKDTVSGSSKELIQGHVFTVSYNAGSGSFSVAGAPINRQRTNNNSSIM